MARSLWPARPLRSSAASDSGSMGAVGLVRQIGKAAVHWSRAATAWGSSWQSAPPHRSSPRRGGRPRSTSSRVTSPPEPAEDVDFRLPGQPLDHRRDIDECRQIDSGGLAAPHHGPGAVRGGEYDCLPPTRSGVVAGAIAEMEAGNRQSAPLAAEDVRALRHGGGQGLGVLDFQTRPHLDRPGHQEWVMVVVARRTSITTAVLPASAGLTAEGTCNTTRRQGIVLLRRSGRSHAVGGLARRWIW